MAAHVPHPLQAIRSYYDEFSHRYEAERRPNRPDGYHALVDDLEVEVVRRHGAGRDVLECGVGTGLILQRIAEFARTARGIDLSPGMLAHVPEIGKALAEMARVTRPGGVVLAEFYNPISLRGVVKRWGPAGKISRATREDAVYTRFDPPWIIPRLLPPSLTLEAVRGVRIVTPAAAAMRIPAVARIFRQVEQRLADTPAAFFGGFYVAVLRKRDVD